MRYEANYSIENLKDWDKNPRKNDKAVDKLSKLIEKYGFINPVVIDQNGTIRAGHTRVKSAKKLGLKEIPVLIVDFKSEQDAIGYAIADNKSQEWADWDDDLLKEIVNELKEANFDMDMTGLKETEINRILNENIEPNKGNKEPKYKINFGDVYKLGNHYVKCGDSTKEETYDFIKNECDMIFTDPPYGVSYSGINNPNGRDWDVIEGDDLRGDALFDFIYESFSKMFNKLKTKGAIYVFHASRNQIIFEKALNKAGFQVKQQLIWNKHHILGHSDYHYCHEPLFYGSKINEQPIFYGDRIDKTILNKMDVEKMTEKEIRDFLKEIIKNDTFWTFKKDSSRDYIHPTQKPVKLMEKAIINSSKPESYVLEPFGGSGSTLIACENTNRKCYLIEFSPEFCSHIIERWENYTKKEAIKQ